MLAFHQPVLMSQCALTTFNSPYTIGQNWSLGPHHLFNSALVLGIIAVKDPHSDQCDAILEDLTACCDIQRGDIWLDEFSLAEVKIIELCIKKSKQFRENCGSSNRAGTSLGTRLGTMVDARTVCNPENKTIITVWVF